MFRRERSELSYLSQANFVGQGYDIYGAYSINDSTITPLFDPEKAELHTIKFLGQEYVVPSYVTFAEDTSATYWEDTAVSRDDYQNSIAANAEVHANYGAFSGQMKAAFGAQFSKNTQNFYSYRTFFSRLGMLSLLHDNLDKYLTDYFLQRVADLPGEEPTDDNIYSFAEFFEDFGIYYVSAVHLGASLQYNAAVATASQMTAIDISTMLKVEYNALFAGGGVSAETSASAKWQNYRMNRNVNILANGGDISLLAQLTAIDPDNPSAATVDLYTRWANTIALDPGIANFRLKGIWELTGDKRPYVEAAFFEYGRNMRPRMFVEVSSATGKDHVPVITGGNIPILPPPQFGIGYRMMILDRFSVNAEPLFDKYYSTPAQISYREYENMYNTMADELQSSGYFNSKYVLVIASFGVSSNAPPTTRFYTLLRSAGGGSKLQSWVDGSDRGSSMSSNTGYYALVGVPMLGPETGVEIFESSWRKESKGILEVLFYRHSTNTPYTLGGGHVQQKTQNQRRNFDV